MKERKKEITATNAKTKKEKKKKKWDAENPDWNRVVIIPQIILMQGVLM